MSFEDPATQDRPVIDSGVHIRDSERAPASAMQIGMAAVLVIAILSVFFYGVTTQREPVAGATAPSQQATNVPAPAQPKPDVGTTGAAPKPENPPGATRQQQPQKAESTPAGARGGGNEVQPPTAPQKNQ